MDIATGLGLAAGATVVLSLIFMGGDLRMMFSDHAVIIIFGGSFAATLIRFPLSSIFHGLPLGIKFVFSMRRISQRELVDEIAGLAEIARKQGPIGLEKVEIEDPFLAKGIRFVADGYEAEFIRDNLERDRDNFLTHLDEGQKIYRAVGDKLHLKLVDEEINRTLIIDGVLMMRDSKSPTLVREMLLAYLPEKHRHEEAEPEPPPA